MNEIKNNGDTPLLLWLRYFAFLLQFNLYTPTPPLHRGSASGSYVTGFLLEPYKEEQLTNTLQT